MKKFKDVFSSLLTFLFRRGMCFIFGLVVLLVSCQKDFDSYYQGNTTITKNVIEILEGYPECSDFVTLIDELRMRQPLGEGALFTVFAPPNESVSEFLVSKPTLQEKRDFVNGCFVSGIYYEYDIQKSYGLALENENEDRVEHLFFKTRTEGSSDGRFVKLFTSSFFESQPNDYSAIYGSDGSDFMIEDVSISVEKRDIGAANGVVNILEGNSPTRVNLEKSLALDPDLSIVNNWYGTFRNLGIKGSSSDPNVIIDTTTVISYSFPSARNIATEGTRTMLLIPTNQAIMDYYGAYYPSGEEVPEFIQGQQLSTFTFADVFLKNGLDAALVTELQSVSGTYVKGMVPELTEHIVGAISASNGIIYKMDKVIPTPFVSSLLGGIYFLSDAKEWSNWLYLIDNTSVEDAMYDPIEGLHAPMTLLIQPDNYWDVPAGEGDITQQTNSAKMGQIFVDVRESGGFKYRYYGTLLGDILFDPLIGNYGGFIGWANDTSMLLASDAAYANEQGQIFEVNGELLALTLDNDDHPEFIKSVWNVISNNSEYSKFADLCRKIEYDIALDVIGFTYTAFVPVNDAIPIDPETCTEEEARNFVLEHVSNFKIYTDGVQSMFLNQNERQLNISGSWENWTITDSKDVTHTCNLPLSNVQTMNGIVHEVNTAFTYNSGI